MELVAIGTVESPLTDQATAPKQGDEGAPEAALVIDDPANPVQGVFNTRSQDRPNPIGVHPVTVLAVEGTRLRVRPLEALDGTPIVDLKPVLRSIGER